MTVTTAQEGRRRALEARYPLALNGLELCAVVGTDPAQIPALLPLPSAPLPSGLAGRVALLRFVTTEGVPSLGAPQVQISGATVRWVLAASALGTVGTVDPALDAFEVQWLKSLRPAIEAAPGLPDRFLVALTQAPMPAELTVRIQRDAGNSAAPAGFEPRLTSTNITRSGDYVTAVARATWLNGIDHLLVADRKPLLSERLRQRIVFVCLANAAFATELRASDLAITGGVRVEAVPVRWVWPLSDIERVVDGELTSAERAGLASFLAQRTARQDAARWIVLCTETRGDYSLYTLTITAPPHFDALLSSVSVNFKIDCLAQLDCQSGSAGPRVPDQAPVLDYMTRDFAGFRRLLVDRLAVLGASDGAPNQAGVLSVLVDAIAARADRLAYAQDAVATEAYLHTARLRSSVRRHARMLDYTMHEGVNARAFVHFVAGPGVNLVDAVQAGDLLLTRIGPTAGAVLPAETLTGPLPLETQVFRALLPLRRLSAAENEIGLHTWGEEELCLERGATTCTLLDPGRALALDVGDLLFFEAVASAGTGAAEDRDPALRHVVRLAETPRPRTDALLQVEVLDVEWLPEDALPFCLPVRAAGRTLAVARGNLSLVDHGKPAVETVKVRPWGSRGRLRAPLSGQGLTFTTRRPTWDDATDVAWRTTTWSASSVLRQAPELALPDVSLRDASGVVWVPQRDLLASDRSAAEFWVEMESDGRATVRFGDGLTGQKPADDSQFEVHYRVGNGSAGNVGAEAIAHVLTTRIAPGTLVAVRNPLPASGGRDAESLDEVRRSAPHAFRRQERAVTLADWAEVAERHGEVQRAVARLLWTGSWHRVRVHVDRSDGRPVDARFIAELTTFLERFRLAGYDLEVTGPEHVPLDLVFSVCVEPRAWPEAVAQGLREAFGTGLTADGTRAFFHPDNFTFGDSVYLSQLVARAMQVPGVRWVDTRAENPQHRFRRWSAGAGDAFATGVLKMGPLEIPRCDSNPSAPERGRIQFHVEGGA